MENTREILVAIAPEPSDYPNPLPPLGFSGDGSVNPLTAAAQIEAALTQVNQQLTEFVASANFQGDLQTAFGASTDVELGATIIKALEDKGFKYIEEFTLNDIYMKNDKSNEFAPKNGRITDTVFMIAGPVIFSIIAFILYYLYEKK